MDGVVILFHGCEQSTNLSNLHLNKVYDEIALEREHKCTGCGRYDVPLSHSHLIPRSRRKDLITNKRNIT